MIRKATPQDAHAIAQLTYIIWQDMDLEIVQRYPADLVIDAVMRSTTEVKYRTHIQHVDVYEIEGQVAGMGVCPIRVSAKQIMSKHGDSYR
ncbi:hypothetical protein [Staphylococcus lutrae]|uniref:hypothetical protein n=1 Tax=Staphylococcus lutrae TaxID=155085 RepID=UPI001F0C6169|nr:hypothetical protein [Staphylococcus lutrae]